MIAGSTRTPLQEIMSVIKARDCRRVPINAFRLISLEDWNDLRQLTVWFENASDFAELFSEHDDYKTYYAR
jgi:hypothetical protein